MSRPRTWFLPASLVAVAFALLTLPMAVSAAPPVVETFHNEGSFTFAAPCPNGVTLVGTFTEDVRVTTFFDRAGNPVRSSDQGQPKTARSPTRRPARAWRIPSHQTITEDLVEGTVTQVGLVFKATVPGVGVVFHDVGRVVVDAEDNVIFEAGPHDVLNTAGDHVVRANFCAALT